MIRRICLGLLLLAVAAALPAPIGEAAGSGIAATVPDTPIRVNGQPVDNAHAKYPFLLYRDITYLPLTWDHTSALGIQLFWDEDGTMHIAGGYGRGAGNFIGWSKQPFRQDLSAERRLGGTVAVSKAALPVVIENEPIDNERETYPLLEYQGIVYLPLTWHFAHELLHLPMSWDPAGGLNVVGGQQPILGSIVYDDADYLYIGSVIITEPWQGGLMKVHKSLEQKPVWMTKEETQQVQDKIDRARSADPYRGIAAETEAREDGLYFKGLKLLERPEMSAPGSMPAKLEWTAKEFKLEESKSLLAVQRRMAYEGASRSMDTTFVFLIAGGKAAFIEELKREPYRVIPNGDGSYWIAADGRTTIRHLTIDSYPLALLDPQGNVRLMNKEWDEMRIAVLGLEQADPHAGDGRLYVELGGVTADGANANGLGGLYAVDADANLTKMHDPLSGTRSFYLGADKRLYSLTEPNTVTDVSEGKAAMWYDYELAGSE
ncbi:hypothetical protein [Paenibacillus sp. GYB003]|uniref:hypothetical protein n=1 Tax=Paenibacillus sp. GYB003 TaxID=2994392 RepID=UPI002F963DFB